MPLDDNSVSNSNITLTSASFTTTVARHEQSGQQQTTVGTEQTLARRTEGYNKSSRQRWSLPDDVFLQNGFRKMHHVLCNLPDRNGYGRNDEQPTDEDELVLPGESIFDRVDDQQRDNDN